VRRPRVGSALAITVCLILTLAACTKDAPTPRPTDPRGRWLAAVDGLCAALDQAGDVAAAERTFYDRSHDALHEIAAAAQDVDPEATAALLTAKNAVETDLRKDAKPPALRGHLQTLIAATVDVLAALGVDSPGCA
jgi:hypothetical protein